MKFKVQLESVEGTPVSVIIDRAIIVRLVPARRQDRAQGAPGSQCSLL